MPDEKPAEKIAYDPATDPKFILQAKKMDLEAGWIGRVIGSAKNAPNNLAFLGLLLASFAALIGLLVTLFRSNQQLEIWRYITPIMTLAMGYVFGQKSSEK